MGNRDKRFRTRLTELMEKHDLTRMDLVRRANFSYITVMAWENEELRSIDATKVYDLMQLLNCTMDELLYIVDMDKTE